MYATNQAIAETQQHSTPKYPLAVPIAIAAAGVSAILLALYMANRHVVKLTDENQYDVENYEVKDKPYIYGICE
ncbi:MAG: hypothetical protein ACXWDO_09795 [Bacteroidia bacterium]